jgi:predicted enzyme involved in methoxymalonyl-ACP biosynthesis
MTLSIAPFDAAGRKRIAQLISKSNQFNVTTRRYSEAEVAALQSNPDAVTLQARLEDIFGDNGMISAVICLRQDRRGNRYLDHVVQQARAAGITELIGRYLPTAKMAWCGIISANWGLPGSTPCQAAKPRGGWSSATTMTRTCP